MVWIWAIVREQREIRDAEIRGGARTGEPSGTDGDSPQLAADTAVMRTTGDGLECRRKTRPVDTGHKIIELTGGWAFASRVTKSVIG